MMDILLFPSIFEGLPLALVEAQINSLPCLLSENIDNDAIISTTSQRLSLSYSAHKWATELIKIGGRGEASQISEYQLGIYNIKNTVNKISKLYNIVLEMAKD
jgi:hypothetical protein